LYGVVCDAQPACELSPIVVACERCRHQPTASLSQGIQVRSAGYGSGTQERLNGTGCVQERAASAGHVSILCNKIGVYFLLISCTSAHQEMR